MDLFSYAESTKARDDGCRKVALNNLGFMQRALDHLKMCQFVRSTNEFTGEDIRRWLSEAGIEPAHQNAYGALILTAQRRKIIVGTGVYVPMKLKTSRARKNQVYAWA